MDEKERCLLALGYAPGGSNIGATLKLALSSNVRAQVGLPACPHVMQGSRPTGRGMVHCIGPGLQAYLWAQQPSRNPCSRAPLLLATPLHLHHPPTITTCHTSRTCAPWWSPTAVTG